MKYKATIVIPCYNKEQYIRKALKSIVNLSRFNDFEVILVDDCSKDRTVERIKKYSDKYDNIRLIAFEEGSGSPSKPRNVGIENSTTDYIIFMDPDDQIINDGYSVLLNKMEEYKSDIVIGTRIGVNEYGQKIFTDFIDKKYTYINSNDYSIKLDLLNRNPYILKTIYSKKLLMDNNIRFNEKITTSEDESFDIKCIAYAKKITKINDIVYQYTVEAEGSITTNVSLRVYKDLYDVMVELYNSYKLLFSEEIISERIVALVYIFYVKKMTYLSSNEEIEQACIYIYEAFEKFGFEKIDKLTTRKYINFLEDVKNKNFSGYINFYFLRRIELMSRKMNMLRKENENYVKILNRKLVKPGIFLVSLVTSIKKKIKKIKRNKNKNKNKVSERTLERKEYFNMFKDFYSKMNNNSNGYWLFMDRKDNAKDNAEALYRYVMKNKIHDKIAYILDKDSIDYDRLSKEGFNLIQYDSMEHWLMQKNCEYLFTSHCDELNLYPWYYIKRRKQYRYIKNYPVNHLFKLVFLQHGVIRSDLSDWLGGKDYYKFITSSPYEKESLLSIPRYKIAEEQILLSGLPRWDYLEDNSKNVITIFPTWRKEITLKKGGEITEEEMLETDFYKNWNALLNAEFLKKLPSDFKINFISHHDNVPILKYFNDRIPDRINIVNYNEIENFYDIVNTTKVFITDYSSFSFDFLYENKAVIYFDFEKNALLNNVKSMEYSKFGYYCTNISDVQKSFEILKKNKYKPEKKYLDNINNLFAYKDNNNCKRVIEGLEKKKPKIK